MILLEIKDPVIYDQVCDLIDKLDQVYDIEELLDSIDILFDEYKLSSKDQELLSSERKIIQDYLSRLPDKSIRHKMADNPGRYVTYNSPFSDDESSRNYKLYTDLEDAEDFYNKHYRIVNSVRRENDHYMRGNKITQREYEKNNRKSRKTYNVPTSK